MAKAVKKKNLPKVILNMTPDEALKRMLNTKLPKKEVKKKKG